MDDEGGESMEPVEEVPLKEELGDAELESWLRGWRREAGSWFQRRGEAYWKERSVICREDDVDGRASVTKDEEQVLRGGSEADIDEAMQIWGLGGFKNFVLEWKELEHRAQAMR